MDKSLVKILGSMLQKDMSALACVYEKALYTWAEKAVSDNLRRRETLTRSISDYHQQIAMFLTSVDAVVAQSTAFRSSFTSLERSHASVCKWLRKYADPRNYDAKELVAYYMCKMPFRLSVMLRRLCKRMVRRGFTDMTPFSIERKSMGFYEGADSSWIQLTITGAVGTVVCYMCVFTPKDRKPYLKVMFGGQAHE